MNQERTAFTPGPWVVNPFSARVDCEQLSNLGGLLPVAQMLGPTDERSEAETEANAHLIAAAPELYGALVEAKREMWTSARHQWPLADFKNWAVVQQIDAALAKARGEQPTPAHAAQVTK